MRDPGGKEQLNGLPKVVLLSNSGRAEMCFESLSVLLFLFHLECAFTTYDVVLVITWHPLSADACVNLTDNIVEAARSLVRA